MESRVVRSVSPSGSKMNGRSGLEERNHLSLVMDAREFAQYRNYARNYFTRMNKDTTNEIFGAYRNGTDLKTGNEYTRKNLEFATFLVPSEPYIYQPPSEVERARRSYSNSTAHRTKMLYPNNYNHISNNVISPPINPKPRLKPLPPLTNTFTRVKTVSPLQERLEVQNPNEKAPEQREENHRRMTKGVDHLCVGHSSTNTEHHPFVDGSSQTTENRKGSSEVTLHRILQEVLSKQQTLSTRE